MWCVDGLKLTKSRPALGKRLTDRQTPVTKVFFLGLLVAQEWSFPAKQTVCPLTPGTRGISVSFPHISRSLPAQGLVHNLVQPAGLCT